MLKRFLTRLAVLLLLTTLFRHGNAAPDQIDGAVARAIDSISSVITNGVDDHTDDVLKKLGYGPEYTSQIADWAHTSSYLRIETMVLSAEQAERGSGQRALALMSRAMAQDYPAHLEDAAIKALPSSGNKPLQFAKLQAPSPQRLAPHLDEAVFVIATYVDEGAMSVSRLLHHAGVPHDAIMELVREHPTPREVLTRAAQRSGDEVGFVHRLLETAQPFHPTIAHEEAVKTFRRRNPPEPPPGAPGVTLRPESPRGGPGGASSGGPRRPPPEGSLGSEVRRPGRPGPRTGPGTGSEPRRGGGDFGPRRPSKPGAVFNIPRCRLAP